MNVSIAKPSLWDAVEIQPETKPQRCHFKGCKKPVVGASSNRGEYVCDRHNDLEYAHRFANGKVGSWRKFGQRWLAELNHQERGEE